MFEAKNLEENAVMFFIFFIFFETLSISFLNKHLSSIFTITNIGAGSQLKQSILKTSNMLIQRRKYTETPGRLKTVTSCDQHRHLHVLCGAR